jgi:hypothetical protein
MTQSVHPMSFDGNPPTTLAEWESARAKRRAEAAATRIWRIAGACGIVIAVVATLVYQNHEPIDVEALAGSISAAQAAPVSMEAIREARPHGYFPDLFVMEKLDDADLPPQN